MARRLRVPIMLGLGLFAVLIGAAAFSSAAVSYRSADRDGARVAEVLIGERVVVVLRTAAGGYAALERAEIVANRLRSAMAASIEHYDVAVGPVTGGHGVFMAEQLIVTATETEAGAQGATPDALAMLWGENIVLALGGDIAAEEPSEDPGAGLEPYYEETPGENVEPAAEETVTTSAAEPAAAEAVDWTGTAQKWVPVFSLETEGVRIGFAQVAGPPSQVGEVKGVAQLRLNFRGIGRIYAYIPVSSISMKLDRVQGVSVWALADVKVLNF